MSARESGLQIVGIQIRTLANCVCVYMCVCLCMCVCVSAYVLCVWAQREIIGPGVHEQLGGCKIVIGVCICVIVFVCVCV